MDIWAIALLIISLLGGAYFFIKTSLTSGRSQERLKAIENEKKREERELANNKRDIDFVNKTFSDLKASTTFSRDFSNHVLSGNIASKDQQQTLPPTTSPTKTKIH